MAAIGFQGQHLLLELTEKLVFTSVHYDPHGVRNIDVHMLHSPYPDFIEDCAHAAAAVHKLITSKMAAPAIVLIT